MSYIFCPPEDKDVHVLFAVSQGIHLPHTRLEWNMRTNRMDVNGVPYAWVDTNVLPVFQDGNMSTYTVLLKQMTDSHLVQAEFPSYTVSGPGRHGFFAPAALLNEWQTYYALHSIMEEA